MTPYIQEVNVTIKNEKSKIAFIEKLIDRGFCVDNVGYVVKASLFEYHLEASEVKIQQPEEIGDK